MSHLCDTNAMRTAIIGLTVCWLIIFGFVIGTTLVGVYYYPKDQPAPYATGNCSVVCTEFDIRSCGCNRKREAEAAADASAVIIAGSGARAAVLSSGGG